MHSKTDPARGRVWPPATERHNWPHGAQWKAHLRPVVAADGTGATGCPFGLEQGEFDRNAGLSIEDQVAPADVSAGFLEQAETEAARAMSRAARGDRVVD